MAQIENRPELRNGHQTLAAARSVAARYIYEDVIGPMSRAHVGLRELADERMAAIEQANLLAAGNPHAGVAPRAVRAPILQGVEPHVAAALPNARAVAGQLGVVLASAVPAPEVNTFVVHPPVPVDVVVVGNGSSDRYRQCLPHVRRVHLLSPTLEADCFTREVQQVAHAVLPLTGEGFRVTRCAHKLRDCTCFATFGPTFQDDLVDDWVARRALTRTVFVLEHVAYHLELEDWMAIPVGSDVLMSHHVFPKATGNIPQKRPEYTYLVRETKRRRADGVLGRIEGEFEVVMASMSAYDAGKTFVHRDITRQLISGVWVFGDTPLVGPGPHLPFQRVMAHSIVRTVFGSGVDENGNEGGEALLVINQGRVCDFVQGLVDSLIAAEEDKLMAAREARVAHKQAEQIAAVRMEQAAVALQEVARIGDLDWCIINGDITAKQWKALVAAATGLISKLPMEISPVALVDSLSRIHGELSRNADFGNPNPKLCAEAVKIALGSRMEFMELMRLNVTQRWSDDAITNASNVGGFKLLGITGPKVDKANEVLLRTTKIVGAVTGLNLAIELLSGTKKRAKQFASC